MAVDQHDTLVGKGTAVTVGVTHGDIGQFRVAPQRPGAVIAHGVALGVAVDRGDMGLELHHALVVGVRRHRVAEQRTARANHVQMRFRHFQGGERVGRMQGDFAAIEFCNIDQPLCLLVERLEPCTHVVGVFYREVGHDRAHFQVRHLGDGDRVAAALGGGHFHAVAAHAAGVQAQVHHQRTAVFFGNQAGLDGEIKVAHQLFHIVRQRRFQLAEGCRTHTDQLALEAAFTYHASLFIARHANARHTGSDD